MDPSRFDQISKRFASRRLSRRRALQQLGAGGMVVGLLGAAGPATSAEPATPAASASPSAAASCAHGDTALWAKQMTAYAGAGTYPAIQANAGSQISSVMVEIPPITLTGPGQSATLPVGPCQFIYRYKFSNVVATAGAAGPFIYVEVDWNTEGAPRGPNGSFISPHFDFHFYMLPRTYIEQNLACALSANGKTCDPFKTAYEQTRRFQ